MEEFVEKLKPLSAKNMVIKRYKTEIEEAAKEIKRNYTPEKPPRKPKGYMLVDTYVGVNGFLNFKYVKIPTYKKRVIDMDIPQNKKTGMP